MRRRRDGRQLGRLAELVREVAKWPNWPVFGVVAVRPEAVYAT